MFLTILHHYLIWHYSHAFAQILNVWKNLLWFVVHFFSMPDLLRSWASPWKRMTEQRRKSWDIEDMMGTIFINLLSRFIGFIMRTAVLAIGLLALLITFLGGILTYLIWMTGPGLILLLIILGITYII